MHYKSKCYIISGSAGALNTSITPNLCTYREAQWLLTSIVQKSAQKRVKHAEKASQQPPNTSLKRAISIRPCVHTVRRARRRLKDRRWNSGHTKQDSQSLDAVFAEISAQMDCGNAPYVIASWLPQRSFFIEKQTLNGLPSHANARSVCKPRTNENAQRIFIFQNFAMMDCVNAVHVMPFYQKRGSFSPHVQSLYAACNDSAGHVNKLDNQREGGRKQREKCRETKTWSISIGAAPANMRNHTHLLLMMHSLHGPIGSRGVLSVVPKKVFGGNYRWTTGFPSHIQTVPAQFQRTWCPYVGD